MLDVSSSLADSLFGWANVVLIVGAALVLIGTIGSIKLAAVREHFSDVRISDNERETKTAIAESDVAKADAAKANVLAAELEKAAADARLETEKLKSVVAWRTISLENQAAIEKVLSAKPGSVNLRWQDGDPEALFLAIQISSVLGRAAWQVAPGSFKPANSILFGIVLPPVSGADADALREALMAGHVSFSSIPVSQDGASFNVSNIGGAPFLMIGSRLPVAP